MVEDERSAATSDPTMQAITTAPASHRRVIACPLSLCLRGPAPARCSRGPVPARCSRGPAPLAGFYLDDRRRGEDDSGPASPMHRFHTGFVLLCFVAASRPAAAQRPGPPALV